MTRPATAHLTRRRLAAFVAGGLLTVGTPAALASAPTAFGQDVPPLLEQVQTTMDSRVVPLAGSQSGFTITGTSAVFSILVFEDGQPVDPCRGVTGPPDAACQAARAVVARFFPDDPCRSLLTGTTGDPCRIVATLTTARGVSASVSCALAGVSAAPVRSGTSVFVGTTIRLLNPFASPDPCRLLEEVRVRHNVELDADGSIAAVSSSVTEARPPDAAAEVIGVRRDRAVDLSWVAPSDNGSPITHYVVQVRRGTSVVRNVTLPGNPTAALITGLTNGFAYNFRLRAFNAFGPGPLSAPSPSVTPATLPDPPIIRAPAQGAAGGPLTAIANWSAPRVDGGAAISSYTVTALRMAEDLNTPVPGAAVTTVTGPAARSAEFRLDEGAAYRFEVVATNAVGDSPPSARSAPVLPR